MPNGVFWAVSFVDSHDHDRARTDSVPAAKRYAQNIHVGECDARAGLMLV